MQERSAAGAMLAAFVPEARVRELQAAVEGLELAVVNGLAHHVVAGPPEAVEAARALLAAGGEAHEPLTVDRAFHTALLDPVLDELRTAVEKTGLLPLRTPFVSGLDGVVRRPGWRPGADHLVRQARRTADFHAVLRAVGSTGSDRPTGPAGLVLLELGPSAALTGMARRVLPGAAAVPTSAFRHAVARLHCAGVAVDWAALLAGCGGRMGAAADVSVPASVPLGRSAAGPDHFVRTRAHNGGWHDRTGRTGPGFGAHHAAISAIGRRRSVRTGRTSGWAPTHSS